MAQCCTQVQALDLGQRELGMSTTTVNLILLGLLNRKDLTKPTKNYVTNCLPLLKT